MLCELAEGPRHVSDLARLVGLSQSCATRHVQALARAGGVDCRRTGKRVMVSLRTDDEVMRSLLGWISGGSAPARAPDPSPARASSAVARARRPRPAAARPQNGGGEELSPAEPGASGTSSGHSNARQPAAPNRSRALEDFLL
ncbi:MAG: helix-turn-helix transcriptional regulator [Candidatus Eisenbacteria bacterium]|nr:helix-turn-helix transcriptional regulator [Candidatus Eisenbacteria bacterium]